ncbi:type II secretion system F family protein [Campylobacter troglodytis]|uniref:type II secretion system F family protein n=1 Tax=Campylobacter troglodytis TaxID=654363 RepID=UPI001159378C|nr:type II secretion system F family protein [Campylobacter troglodytis]TQR57700.1 type II secretion system F family protein [Campylobacter troglodytis]
MKKYEIFTPQKSFIIKAENKFNAAKLAKARGAKILNIQELENKHFVWKKRLKVLNLALFFKELSLLLGTGLSLQQALNELLQNNEEKAMKNFLQALIASLKSGQSLSQAFENSPFAFNESEIALIKMSENTGDLSFVFARLALLREQDLANLKKLKKALSYPLFVFATLIIAFCALMLFVVPQFESIFTEFNIALPLVTVIMLDLSSFLSKFYPLILALLALVFISTTLLYKGSHAFAYTVNAFVLRLPVLGRLIFYHQSASFFLIFSMLIKSGISLSKALNLSKNAFSNLYLQAKCLKIAEFLEQGLALNEAFKKAKLFESLVLGMLGVAMKSGRLDLMAEKIALFYEDKEEALREKMLGLLEPLMTLLVAILVLFLALGIFLPMWELNQSVKF